MASSLTKLANKYKTDKGYKHNYVDDYDRHFKKFRNKNISLLELGISQGASLLMWKEYFSKGNIVGMDVFKGEHYEGKVEIIQNKLIENDINFVVGSQTDADSINEAVKKYSPTGFEIIIDDASHNPEDQQISMAFLLPWLKNGGYYVIEDLNYKCDPRTSTLRVIEKFQRTGVWESPFLSKVQNRLTGELIKKIELCVEEKIAFIS